MGGLTRKELLAGAAAAGVVAGCGGSSKKRRARPARLGVGQGAVRALARTSATSTPSCSPRTRSRCARRSSATGAGSTPTRPATCTRTRLELDERVLAGGRALPRGAAGLRVHRLDDDGPRARLRRHPDQGPAGGHRARLLLDARVAAAALRGLRADPALRRPGAGHGERDGRGGPRRVDAGPARAHLGALRAPASRSRRRRSPRRCDPTLVVLDGVHGLAADDLPIDSVDVLVAGTHKWLGGPRGTGLVWSRAWDRLQPVHPDLPPRLARPRTGTPAATTRSSTAGRSPRRSTSTTGSGAPRSPSGSRASPRGSSRASPSCATCGS